MKKNDLINLERECFFEKLDNGLEIYMIPMFDKKNYFISYATRFGSDVLEFSKDKKKYKPPLGIAHFLEHKMFEQEDGIDPFSFFSESGTDSNASTTFDNTQYICSGTKDFNKNLKYLLSFVNSPYFTEDNVEKEKGIIAEEIKMYEDMPDFKLEMVLRECLYNKHPRRIDIAGTIDEINKITKEDLYNCYNNFYVPNNMFILIVGNFNIEDALEIIKKEVGNKEKVEKTKVKKILEKVDIKTNKLTIKHNIEVPKIGLGLKVGNLVGIDSDLEIDLYLTMFTTILFGASSSFREKVRKNKLLNSIYTEWESVDNLKTFYLMATTLEPDKLIKEIIGEFENIDILEEDFERIKKVWIANEVKIYDNVDLVVNNSYDDIIKYGKLITDRLDIIKNMKLDKLNKIIKKIDFNNISIVKMVNNK